MEGHLQSWKIPGTMILPPMLPTYTSLQASQFSYREEDSQLQEFTLFPKLPPEIRANVYKMAFTPRIIKWTRMNNQNKFTVPSKSFPLFDLCHEARQVALLYGEYRNISTVGASVYFSPLVDYLLFDAVWVQLTPTATSHLSPQAPVDPLDSILPELRDTRKIMVHPNFTNDRKKPTALFEKLPKLEQLLIVADEKSMGVQNKYTLSTVYDAKMYYTAKVKMENPEANVPHIAVGCLGWRGAERRSLRHGNEDKRQLVGVFETYADMAMHLQLLREEERNFLEESFRRDRPKLTLNLRPAQTQSGTHLGSAKSDSEDSDGEAGPDPPSYSKAAKIRIVTSAELSEDASTAGSSETSGVTDIGKKTRPRRWYQKILRGEILSLANSSSVVIKQRD